MLPEIRRLPSSRAEEICNNSYYYYGSFLLTAVVATFARSTDPPHQVGRRVVYLKGKAAPPGASASSPADPTSPVRSDVVSRRLLFEQNRY